MKYTKSKTVTSTVTLQQIEDAIKIIAFASLKENGESIAVDNVEAEAARIERCVEYYYRIQEHDLQYPDFAKQFLFENQKELIYGSKFLEDYLDDVSDSFLEREMDSTQYSLTV